jgi:hypothetical protein
MGGERGKGCSDLFEWDARRAAGLDHCDPAKHGPLVSALVPCCSAGDDQALLLVEAEC